VGDETRVSIDHRGFDRVPAESAARHRMPDAVLLRQLATYWRSNLDGYRAAVTNIVFPG
jgi:hypothetical protein